MTFTPARTFYDPERNLMWEPYRVTYSHNGSTFDCRIQATSFSHAEQMLNDLKRSGEVTGVVVMEEV